MKSHHSKAVLLLTAPLLLVVLAAAQAEAQTFTGLARPGRDLGGPFATFPAIRGKVLLDTGGVQEPIRVELLCAGQLRGSADSDAEGNFSLSIGDRNSPDLTTGSAAYSQPSANSRISLQGCELQVVQALYYPLTTPLAGPLEAVEMNVGTLVLRRIAPARGDSVNINSLMVPAEAQREFDKGLRELEKKDTEAAQKHLEAAVEVYQKFPAAWHQLGRVYQARGDAAKAEKAYRNAIAADPEFLDAYVALASLLLEENRWEPAAKTAGQALEIDAATSTAGLIQALAYLNMNRLDESEQSALNVKRNAARPLPRVYVVLAEISLRRQDYEEAASHMRQYLEGEPEGPFAPNVRKVLREIAELL